MTVLAGKHAFVVSDRLRREIYFCLNELVSRSSHRDSLAPRTGGVCGVFGLDS